MPANISGLMVVHFSNKVTHTHLRTENSLAILPIALILFLMTSLRCAMLEAASDPGATLTPLSSVSSSHDNHVIVM